MKNKILSSKDFLSSFELGDIRAVLAIEIDRLCHRINEEFLLDEPNQEIIDRYNSEIEAYQLLYDKLVGKHSAILK